MKNVLIEGYTADEILALPTEALQSLVSRNEPLVFKVGTATILGQFKVVDNALYMELGHVDDGGEGVLPALVSLAERFAKREGLAIIEWRVHAVHCAEPNIKLRRVLEKRGFVVTNVADIGECYWQRVCVGGS
jgi:hypothetical protein